MGKITVFALLGLIIIGGLGWAIGEQPPRLGHQARQDTHFPSATVPPNRTRIETNMLAGWMLRGESPYLLIDTRPSESYSARHLRRAINREIDNLLSLQSLRRLPRHKPIVIYGTDDGENAAVVEVLRMSGLTAFYLAGGAAGWASLPTSEELLGVPSLAESQEAGHMEAVANQPSSERSGNAPPDTSSGNSGNKLRLGMVNQH